MLKIFYYSVYTGKPNWDKEQQYQVVELSWVDFVHFCHSLSYHLKTTIRGCETKGYNNQGHYFTDSR
jgi:hypothetical protein